METVEALQSAIGCDPALPPPADYDGAGEADGCNGSMSTHALVTRVVQLTAMVQRAERTVAVALGSHNGGAGFDGEPSRCSVGTTTDDHAFLEQTHAECQVGSPPPAAPPGVKFRECACAPCGRVWMSIITIFACCYCRQRSVVYVRSASSQRCTSDDCVVTCYGLLPLQSPLPASTSACQRSLRRHMYVWLGDACSTPLLVIFRACPRCAR